jgi:hypothetical protein
MSEEENKCLDCELGLLSIVMCAEAEIDCEPFYESANDPELYAEGALIFKKAICESVAEMKSCANTHPPELYA